MNRCLARVETVLGVGGAMGLMETSASGAMLDEEEALALAACDDLEALMAAAEARCLLGHGRIVTYSRKVFIPLTKLCRDVCHYCTFAQRPKAGTPAYLSIDEVLAIARAGVAAGCTEALFTLGDKPEARFGQARAALAGLGHETTLSYLREAAERVQQETGLLAHLNPGLMTAQDIASLRPVAASMGLMLEGTADLLGAKGGPHHGSPDKAPAKRLETVEQAGAARVAFTSGILIGLGETRRDRIAALLALRKLHERWAHLQEIIVQNFRAKDGTRMANASEPALEEHLWTIAVARLVMDPGMSIQVPPNLAQGRLSAFTRAGINDWGGVSPVTPDHVNPEAAWPTLDALERETEAAGRVLVPRLPIYPGYVRDMERWIDPGVRRAVLDCVDSEGYAKTDRWLPGVPSAVPCLGRMHLDVPRTMGSCEVRAAVGRAQAGMRLEQRDVLRLLQARGSEVEFVRRAADELRAAVNGETVSYVVNRNINYTNVCGFKCGFCAFSKGRTHAHLRGRAYDVPHEEIARRCNEAWARGASEVCMQGGIHPSYSGETYLAILDTAKRGRPGLHVHAFSPLEVTHGAATLGVSVREFLVELKRRGLGSLPGTAAEILDDAVRAIICPDKLGTQAWLDVMAAAHEVGLPSTSTIMFGHVEGPASWARHLLAVRDLQEKTGGFTEFVPLPFVAMEAPIYLKGQARRGPSFREVMLMHAAARLVLHPLIGNIQASWVKLGAEGAGRMLGAGVNDLGGTLMNESISRAAGAAFGEEMAPAEMERLIGAHGRMPRQRTTLYADAPPDGRSRSFAALPLEATLNNSGAAATASASGRRIGRGP